MGDFKIGDRVEFHSEWPFETITGVVLEVGTRPRELGNATEEFVRVRWERSSMRSAGESTIPTWNARLRLTPPPTRGINDDPMTPGEIEADRRANAAVAAPWAPSRIVATRGARYFTPEVESISRLHGFCPFDLGLYLVTVRGCGRWYVRTSELARILFAQEGL